MSFLGFYFGEEGYNVYKDMHHSSFNTFLHGLFMPFVVYGVLYGLPAMWSKTASQAHNWAVTTYIIYTLYYFLFDFWGGLLTAVFYLPAVMTFPDWQKTAQRNFVVKIVLRLIRDGAGNTRGHRTLDVRAKNPVTSPLSSPPSLSLLYSECEDCSALRSRPDRDSYLVHTNQVYIIHTGIMK